MKNLDLTLLLFFLLCLASISVSAQVFVDKTASGSNDGTSWANAYTDLTNAIMSTPEGGEVWVAAGDYFPGGNSPSRDTSFTLPHNMSLYGGFAGTETDLSQRDFETNVTQLSGDHNGDDIVNNFSTNRADNSRHVMFISEAITSESLIDGFVITNGSSDDSSSEEDLRRGGGILSYGTPSISNCEFTQNFGWFGGGLYPRFNSTDESLTISNCTFRANAAGFGAGIYVNQVSCAISSCTFLENSAEVTGGGLYNDTNQGSTIENCLFQLNIASGTNGGNGGGAIFNIESPSNISQCEFIRNTATARRGGGIYSRGSSALITACFFDENNSGMSTGASIHIGTSEFEANTIISDCEFIGGIANWGGALNVYGELNTVELVNCEMNNNVALANGGAIYVGFGGQLRVIGSEINRNEANNGGAMATQNDLSTIIISDSDVSFNAATRGGAINTFNANDTVMIVNPKIEIIRSSFNFNDCTEQGGVLNLSDTDLTVSSSVFTNNENTSATGAGGVMSLNTGDLKENNHLLINNTFFANDGAVGSVIGNWTDSTGVSDLILQNNIFSNSSTEAYAIEDGTPTLTSRGGNLSDDNSLAPFANATNDTHNEFPQLLSPAFGDFSLAEDSPAIDTGIDEGAPELDVTGASRIATVDKGAYEFGQSSSIEDLEVSLRQLSVFPNPSADAVLQYTLDNNWTGAVQLTIRNILGQVVYAENIEKNTAQLSGTLHVSTYENGPYLLNLRNETHSVTRTFIKQ
jgi:predicted outer membrane repeat protein